MSARLLGMGFACDMGTPHRKLVLLKLIDACEDDGTRIFPAVATIARAAQCSDRQVQRELARMVEVGLLSIVREGGKGPRSTREYALDVAMLRRIEEEGWAAVCEAAAEAGAADAAATGEDAKGDRESPLAEPEKGDSGDTIRVTGTTDKGDKLSHPTPPDSSLDPSEREGARAQDGQETEPDGPQPPEENPERAEFQKRVMRFCSGRGFLTGPWPDWDESSPGWIGRQMAALSAAERAEAERWRDPYLLDFRDRKGKPMKVGIFLRDRAWTGLDPALLERFEKWREARLAPGERARPDGWAAMAGPVGMAWLFAALLDGPHDAAAAQRLAGREFFTDPELAAAWERVWQWRARHRASGGVVFAPRWHALKDAMEPVPLRSEVAGLWKIEFSRRGWPWLGEFERGEVIYAPKGGPDGLGGFAAALSQAGQESAQEAGRYDDGGGREAAE